MRNPSSKQTPKPLPELLELLDPWANQKKDGHWRTCPGKIQKVDLPQGPVICTIGVLESRIWGLPFLGPPICLNVV